MEEEKLEMDAALEEVALDKEQLQEEKEALEDRLEELKLDTETAQMEVEELRMELEDTQASVERVTSFKDEATAGGGGGGDGSEAEIKAEELAQVLTAQNARLREALIRLREQSAVETMEVSRQLRTAEKDAEAGRALSTEVEALRAMKVTFAEQINDLKDMVEEGAAFEQMVEDLSDQVMTLEEDSIGLQAMIREMEESAELTSEMEEIQADELKEMSRDLEGRDTIIRNLEEAIKMYVCVILAVCIICWR
jgi:dynactin 1